jgi:hypothetical protein
LPTWTDLDRTTSNMVKALHAWWHAAHGPSGGIPDRKDVDPIALKALLPNILIAEAEHAPFRIRYRLVGTKSTAVTGFDITGRYLDELLSAEADTPWLEYYHRVYQSRAPLLGSTTVPTTSGGHFSYEFGIFPLTLGGDRVEQFIAVEDYFDFRLTSAQMQPWRPSKP